MIPWLAVILLLLIGLLLIVIEVIFVPGTTIVGILGFICSIIGVSLSFSYFGSTIGWSVASITGIISTAVLVYSFKTGIWKRFALNKSIDSKVNDNRPIKLKIGQQGIATSALRPMGKADFDNQELEVSTYGNYVDAQVTIQVTKIEGRKIFVEPIKK